MNFDKNILILYSFDNQTLDNLLKLRKKFENKLQKFTNSKKTGEFIKSQFLAFLLISLGRINVLATTIPHFKGLGMTNLQYDMIICQNEHTRVTTPMPELSSFFETDFKQRENN